MRKTPHIRLDESPSEDGSIPFLRIMLRMDTVKDAEEITLAYSNSQVDDISLEEIQAFRKQAEDYANDLKIPIIIHPIVCQTLDLFSLI